MQQPFFSPYPKYLQIRAVLLRRLHDEFAAGDRFPTESALCARSRASAGRRSATVEQADPETFFREPKTERARRFINKILAH